MNIHFEKRLTRSRSAAILVPILSVVLALVFGALILMAFGINPLEAYQVMIKGSLGSGYALTETLVKAIPLMLTGLGVAIAFRMLFWNIGAEGQLAMGGIAAAFVALFLSDYVPSALLIPLMMLMAVLAGAALALIPAALKSFLGVNEILTTLMMNYIAILFVEYLYLGPWRDPEGFGFPGTAPFPEAAWLPRLVGRVHAGLIIAILAAALVWFILSRTRLACRPEPVGGAAGRLPDGGAAGRRRPVADCYANAGRRRRGAPGSDPVFRPGRVHLCQLPYPHCHESPPARGQG